MYKFTIMCTIHMYNIELVYANIYRYMYNTNTNTYYIALLLTWCRLK